MLAIITVAVAPVLFSRIYPRKDKKIRSGIIIIGQDQLAEYIIDRLQHSGELVVAICPDQDRLERFRDLGVQIIDGCEGFDCALEEAGANEARVLLDLTANSRETLEVCKLGKEKYKVPLVVSRIADVELIPELKKMGIKVVQPELATAMALEGAILYPTAFDVLAHQSEDIDVTEIEVTNGRFSKTRLGDVRFPGDVLVLSLQRDGTVMIPNVDTILQLHDRLGLIGTPICVEDAAAMLTG
jgi:trk system potassium uptake protein TrkA